MKTGGYAVLMVALLGCEAPPESIPDGIYRFEVERIADDCSPLRSEQGGMTSLHVRDGALDVMIPTGPSSFAARTRMTIPLGGTQRALTLTDFSGAGCGSATWSTALDVVSYGAPVTVSYAQTFTDVQPATGNCVSEVPAADCRADHRIHYTLVEVCAEPCRIVWDVPQDAMRCDCSIDGGQ